MGGSERNRVRGVARLDAALRTLARSSRGGKTAPGPDFGAGVNPLKPLIPGSIAPQPYLVETLIAGTARVKMAADEPNPVEAAAPGVGSEMPS